MASSPSTLQDSICQHFKGLHVHIHTGVWFLLFKNTLSNSLFFHPSLWEREESTFSSSSRQQRACCVLGVGHAGDRSQSLMHAPAPMNI